MVLVETERLFVRQWVPDDWKRFRPLGTDPRVLEFLHTEPWSDERIQRFINKGIEVACYAKENPSMQRTGGEP